MMLPFLVVPGTGCSLPPRLPPVQSVVFPSGARLTGEEQRLRDIFDWTLALTESVSCSRQVIEPASRSLPRGQRPRPEDELRTRTRTEYCLAPGSMIRRDQIGGRGANDFRRKLQDARAFVATIPGDEDRYPWETLAIQGDTARVRFMRNQPDLRTPYMVYAYLHLMQAQGRIGEWLPEAAEAEGFALERAIVERVSETWLMGRASQLVDPVTAMDALMLAVEAGHVEAFLFTTRPDEFAEERDRWTRANPAGLEEYRTWYRSTWGHEPPGPRTPGD